MIFRTSLKLSEDKAFGIEIDLPQLPCAYIHGDNIQEIDIMGSYYTVIQILYHHGGKVELILHCKTPKIGGIHKDLLLLEYNGTGESLVQLSIKSSIFPNNMEMVFDILKIPETKLEFIEKGGRVYDVAFCHFKDGKTCEGVSLATASLEDFYKQSNYPYQSILL